MTKNLTTLFREDLLKTVSIANRFVSLKPTLPVLGNLLLRVAKGALNISATNLETSVMLNLPVKETGAWELTVPAKIFNEFLNSTISSEAVLEMGKESITVKTGDTQATIAGIAASEFPSIPTESKDQGLEFEQKEFLEAVALVGSAASSDEGKPVLTGILIKTEGEKTIVVATDGYRLCKKELKNKYNLEELLINAKTLLEVLKISGELGEETVKLSISKTENQALFSGENFLVASRLLSGVYPNFNQIIPTNFTTSISVRRSDLINAIKAAAVFAKDIGNVVKFEISGKSQMQVSANTAQVGQGEAKVAVETKGEPLKVAFNSRYLLDGLGNLSSETLELNFSGPLSPALLQDPKDKSFIYIVMPVKAHN